MKRYAIAVLIIALVSSCSNDAKNSAPEFTAVLADFKDVPKEIDGCTCFFSETSEKYKRQQYIFTAGYDSIAYISINHKLERLTLTASGREPNSFGDYNHTETYRSNLYKVTVDMKYDTTTSYESWRDNGMITIETHDGRKVIKKFVGECGC